MLPIPLVLSTVFFALSPNDNRNQTGMELHGAIAGYFCCLGRHQRGLLSMNCPTHGALSIKSTELRLMLTEAFGLSVENRSVSIVLTTCSNPSMDTFSSRQWCDLSQRRAVHTGCQKLIIFRMFEPRTEQEPWITIRCSMAVGRYCIEVLFSSLLRTEYREHELCTRSRTCHCWLTLCSGGLKDGFSFRPSVKQASETFYERRRSLDSFFLLKVSRGKSPQHP